MNLAVITPAYYPDDKPWKLLRDSCAHHHLPLYAFGQGKQWIGDTEAHFTGALERLRGLPTIYDLIMFTDSQDAFCMAGAEEIELKYKTYECDFLMSTEQSLYPWGLEDLWRTSQLTLGNPGRPFSQPPWEYVNGGGWIGRREKAEEILVYAANAAGNEAQAKWIATYCSGLFNFRLDDQCKIWQTMSCSGDSVEFAGRRLRNKITGSFPAIVHFNGRLGGIESFWEQAYG